MIIFNISPTRTQTPGERKPSPFKSLRLPAILKRPHTHGFASWNRTAECTRYLNVCRVLRVVCHTFLVHVYHLVQMELIQATRTDFDGGQTWGNDRFMQTTCRNSNSVSGNDSNCNKDATWNSFETWLQISVDVSTCGIRLRRRTSEMPLVVLQPNDTRHGS